MRSEPKPNPNFLGLQTTRTLIVSSIRREPSSRNNGSFPSLLAIYDREVPLQFDLHWVGEPERVLYTSCVTVHRCMQQKAPQYFRSYCTFVSDTVNSTFVLLLVRICVAVSSCYGRLTFAVAGLTVDSLYDETQDVVLWKHRRLSFYRVTLCVSAVLAVARCLSVCLSLCLSVRHFPVLYPDGWRYRHIVKLLSRPGSSVILVCGSQSRYPISRRTPLAGA